MTVPEDTRARRQLAAILSADAVGYSRRMAEDEAATVAAMRSHRETLGGFVREHHGRVVNAVGDNMLAEFASAVDAAACAVAVQAELARREAHLPADCRLQFRIGVHLGDLVIEDDEIFGDGINIAARLEALAEPGGVCASSAVVEQVRGKVDAVIEDIGEQALKNIPVPIRVYRLRALVAGEQATANGTTVPGFGGRPAIAILPFEQRGSDATHAFLADGIVEELIGRLSAFRLFPVISRSSTFTYKSNRVDARQVSRELRARYVVEGSVQEIAGRVRIAVQLVDGVQGLQLSSERYDRELGDVFALQDDIVQAIVSTIEPALTRAERQRARQKPPPQLDAWESFQRGAWLLFGLRSKEEMLEAVRFFAHARRLDPDFGTAAAHEAIAHAASLVYQWADDPDRTIAACLAAAEASVALGEDDPWAYTALGYANSFGDRPRAIAAFERAIELNPSLTLAYQGLSGLLAPEHPDEALRVMEKAIRLSPRDPQMHLLLHQLAVAHFMAGRYVDAAGCDEECLRLRADQPHVYRILAASYGYLGRSADALDALAKSRRVAPFSLASFERTNSPALVQRTLEGWRRAGWQSE